MSLEEIKLENFKSINGIAYRNLENIIINKPEKVVPQNRMDIDLPGYAWDLLPYKNKPFDLYRSPMWHAEYVNKNRTPYAAIQTSLGCQFIFITFSTRSFLILVTFRNQDVLA